MVNSSQMFIWIKYPNERRSDIGFEREFMNSVVKKCFVFALLVNLIGLVGCEISDYSELRQKKAESSDATTGDGVAVATLNSDAAGEDSVRPAVEPKIEMKVPVAPEPVKIVGFSKAEEEAVREELEDRDVFFSMDNDGFAVEVDLAECSLGNDGLKQLGKFTKLTKVILDGTKVDSDSFDQLAKILNLEYLDISRSTPSAEDFEKLKPLKRLKFLQLLKATLSAEGMKVLSEYPALEQIRCGQTRVGDEELQYLSELKTLKAIDLSDCNRVTIVGLEALSHCPNLSFLKVWGDSINDEAMGFVAKMKKLKVLGLNDSNVTDEGFKTLAGLDLREIHLFRTSIGDETLRVIAGMPNIAKLNLRDTRLSDQGIEYLTRLKKLEKLDLSECNSPGITDAAGESLAKFSGLKELNLWSTKFSDIGLKPVTSLQGLTSLNLDNTEVTDAGIKMLESMPQLTFLHLGKTKITDASKDSLMGLSNLRYLNISFTGITEDVAYDLDDHFAETDCTVILP
jgi:internalin A